MLKKQLIFFLIIAFVLSMLSSCAYLLSHIVSPGNQKQYTANVYITGLPKEIFDRTGANTYQDLKISETTLSIDFYVSGNKYVYTESKISSISNGLTYDFPGPESNKITIQATFTISYSTDTSLIAYQSVVSIPIKEYTLPNNVKNFYVLIDIPYSDSSTPTVKLIDSARAYKFILRTQNSEIVKIFSSENTHVLLTTESADYKQCTFVVDRTISNVYIFQSESGVTKQGDPKPIGSGQDQEVIDLSN
ncbi:MAG: hypothetical protein ACP5PP_01405 [Fervidobacterium sp.]|jgi:hypothetical protein